MAIYPSNQTTPAKGSGNYLWNWLGSSLKKFGAAISPYITGGDPYKKYVGLLIQENFDPPYAAYVLENTLGWNITFDRAGVGSYTIISDTDWPYGKTVAFLAFPGNAANGFSAAVYSQGAAPALVMESWDVNGAPSDNVIYMTPIEIRVYP